MSDPLIQQKKRLFCYYYINAQKICFIVKLILFLTCSQEEPSVLIRQDKED